MDEDVMEMNEDGLMAKEEVRRAVFTIQKINHMDLDGINPYDLLTAIEALDKQYPMTAIVTHKPGEASARVECNLCGHTITANADLYREYHKKWYCRECGQLCAWPGEGKE